MNNTNDTNNTIMQSRRIHIVVFEKSPIFAICSNPQKMKAYIMNNYKVDSELLYCCWCEGLTKSGKRHIHIYLEFQNKHKLSRLQKLFPQSNINFREGVLSPSQLKKYIAKQSKTSKKEINEIGDFELIKNMTTRKQKLSIDELILQLVNNCNDISEFIAKKPALYSRHKEAIMMLFEDKYSNLHQLENGTISQADNGDDVYHYERQIYYLRYPQYFDFLYHIKLRYGNNVSYITYNDILHGRYDNYNGRDIIIIDLKGKVMSVDELEYLLYSSAEAKLPSRYKDKKSNFNTLIIASHLTFKDAFDAHVNKRIFNCGIWEIVFKDKVYKVKQLFIKNTKPGVKPPISTQIIQHIT